MSEQAGCWVLADGLGGHLGGALASRTACEAVLESFRGDSSVGESAIEAHVAQANRAVLAKQETEPDFASMRTTVVALVADQSGAAWAHSGDSRLYWFREGKIMTQTRDHSVPASLAAAGEIAPEQIRFHEDRARLLRSLGAKPDAQATIGSTPSAPQPGDAFLLASDGFWELVLESEMETGLAESSGAQDWMGRMQARLRDRAASIPDHDNYSAVAVIITKGNNPGGTSPPYSVV